MERDEQLNILIDKYLSGQATPTERAMLERAYGRAVQRSSVDARSTPDISRIGRESWVELADRIAPSPAVRVVSWKKWLAVAASVVAVVITGIIYKYSNDTAKPLVSGQSIFMNDVNPGGHGATLTLGNGRRINLMEVPQGELIREAGAVIRKAEDGLVTYEMMKGIAGNTWNVLTTDSGQTFRVKLSDGSIVILNAASSLKYSADLGREGSRKVYLTGEGYFEIASDPSNPFSVNVLGQQIEVLGTRFNVNSYTGEPDIRTVLFEGAVKVTARGRSHRLEPGQQAINDGTSIRVNQADTEQALDWINGEFALNGLDFRTAMRKIARWYQVDVVFDQFLPDDLQTGGWISRDTKLSEVLTLIEKTGQVYFRVEDRKVYVLKK